jgi:hypothetical protein
LLLPFPPVSRKPIANPAVTVDIANNIIFEERGIQKLPIAVLNKAEAIKRFASNRSNKGPPTADPTRYPKDLAAKILPTVETVVLVCLPNASRAGLFDEINPRNFLKF